MGTKKLVPSSQITKHFIGYFIGLTIISSYIISTLYSTFVVIDMNDISSIITKACLFYIVIVPLSTFIMVRLSFFFIFHNKTILQIDAQSIIIGIIIFFVILFFINFLISYQDFQSRFEKINTVRSLSSQFLTAEEHEEMEKLLTETKQGLDTIFIVYTVLSLASYGIMIPYSKKLLLEYSVGDYYNSEGHLLESSDSSYPNNMLWIGQFAWVFIAHPRTNTVRPYILNIII